MGQYKKLTIYAIARNEAEKIKFWYEQHRELADEFVLIDTGSTDETVKEAEATGVIRVYREPWHHSFAEAKNTALRFCSGDWTLSLSPDTWIDKDNFQKIKEAISETEKVAFWLPLLHHFQDWKIEAAKTIKLQKEEYLTKAHLSLTKRDPRIQWENRVHENLHNSVVKNFGDEAMGFLPFVRHHDNTKNQINDNGKLRYYEFLENFGRIERKIWEAGEELRNQYGK